MHDKTAPQLRVDSTLLTGIDVGGTKVHILDTAGNDAHRYLTNDYPTMEAVLDDYFAKIGRRPARISLVMAGPRDDRTGAVKLTNGTWPIFEPRSAEAHYPGTMFETTNDLVGTMAGALIAPDTDLQTLKKGSVSPQGAKVAFALSTGIGVAASIWDSATKRYTMVAGEGGHIGVYPQDSGEMAYVLYLQQRYPRVSIELALAGKSGLQNIVDHILAGDSTTKLAHAVARAQADGQPVGAVLLRFADAGIGNDQVLAHSILARLGAMLGSALRDFAVCFKTTGGIYLSGSVSLALGDYLASRTSFIARFIHEGAEHDFWLANVPIYLLTDHHVATKGALELARQALITAPQYS